MQPITADNYAAAALAAAANPHPPPPEAPAPGTPPPTPSAARRSVLALPAAPTGDLPAGARLALPAADTVPTLPRTHTFPASPPPPTPYSPPHNHGAAPPRLNPT